jgi:hypothetical protein
MCMNIPVDINMAEKLQEHLISLQTDVGVTLHAYVICPASEAIGERVSNQLCAVADQHGWQYLPVLLQTRLSTGGEVVRKVLSQDETATKSAQLALDGKEKYHLTVFVLPTESSDDKKLMDLH